MLIPNKHAGYVIDGRRLYLGDKGSDVPAPDPRLVEAQIKSMGIQDEAIQRIISNAESMQPLQQEQMQFGLDAAKTAFTQSQEDRAFALGRRAELSGMQDRLISDAKEFNTEAKREQLAAQATADVAQAFEAQRGQQTRQMTRMGVNPASGKFAAMANQMSVQEALGKATAANGARRAARQEGYALTDRATNALSGFPAMGERTTGAGAQYGGMGLTLANTGLAGMNAGFGQAGQMAGQMGQNATSMYGAQATAYNQAQANSGEMWGSILGAGATLGAKAIPFLMSDRRMKQDVELVGRDPRTGLNLYEFAYIGEPHRRYRGVMADEVESKFPDAVAYDDFGFASVDYGKLGLSMQEV